MPFRSPALTALATALLLAGSQAQAVVAAIPDATLYQDETSFTGDNPGLGFQSFESVAGRVRGSGSVTVGGLSVTPLGGALLGVQTGPDSPETGFGSAATHGSHYLFSYQPNVATGTLQFSFTTPTSAFGLNLVDVGETTGEILLQTNNGGQSLVARSFGSGNLLGSGSVLFVGLSQDIPFTSITLTVTGVDDAFGVDKVYVQSVPEPGEWALMLAGLLPVAALARRCRARATA